MPSTNDERQRLFFALWPDDTVQADIDAALALARRGRPVPAENRHLTLRFLGAVDAAARAAALDAAAEVEVPAFELVLDRLGAFRRGGILWLGASETPAALEALVADLEAALAIRGFAPPRRMFQPHMTLARRFNRRVPDRAPPPVRWRVETFCLVASDTHPSGAVYRTLASWPLRAHGA